MLGLYIYYYYGRGARGWYGNAIVLYEVLFSSDYQWVISHAGSSGLENLSKCPPSCLYRFKKPLAAWSLLVPRAPRCSQIPWFKEDLAAWSGLSWFQEPLAAARLLVSIVASYEEVGTGLTSSEGSEPSSSEPSVISFQ